MPLATAKPKFQVTIPARLRKGINLHEGDVMEATIVGDGISFAAHGRGGSKRYCRPDRPYLCGNGSLLRGGHRRLPPRTP